MPKYFYTYWTSQSSHGEGGGFVSQFEGDYDMLAALMYIEKSYNQVGVITFFREITGDQYNQFLAYVIAKQSKGPNLRVTPTNLN